MIVGLLVILLGLIFLSYYWLTRFDRAPDGTSWEEFLRNNDILLEGGSVLEISNIHEVSPGVVSMDLKEKIMKFGCSDGTWVTYIKMSGVFVNLETEEALLTSYYITSSDAKQKMKENFLSQLDPESLDFPMDYKEPVEETLPEYSITEPKIEKIMTEELINPETESSEFSTYSYPKFGIRLSIPDSFGSPIEDEFIYPQSGILDVSSSYQGIPNGRYTLSASFFPITDGQCMLECEPNKETIPGAWGCSERYGDNDLLVFYFGHPSNCFYTYKLEFWPQYVDEETVDRVIASIEFLDVPPGPTGDD